MVTAGAVATCVSFRRKFAFNSGCSRSWRAIFGVQIYRAVVLLRLRWFIVKLWICMYFWRALCRHLLTYFRVRPPVLPAACLPAAPFAPAARYASRSAHRFLMSQTWPLSQDANESSGTCGICLATRQLHIKDGTVHRHGPRDNPCPGSNKPPLSQRAVVSRLTLYYTLGS